MGRNREGILRLGSNRRDLLSRDRRADRVAAVTNDQRELAEYVARWAGWVRYFDGITPGEFYWDPDRNMPLSLREILSDLALAWRAQEELIEMIGFQEAANKVQATMNVLGCTRIEATHRALRAARGGE